MTLEIDYKTLYQRPLVKILGATALTYGVGKLAGIGTRIFTGDGSLETAIDMATPAASFLVGNSAINSIDDRAGRDSLTAFGKQSTRIMLLGGMGFLVGEELMAHEPSNGFFDGMLIPLQDAYSYIQNGYASALEKVPKALEMDLQPLANLIRNYAGGLSMQIAGAAYGLERLRHHTQPKPMSRRKSVKR